MKTTFFSAFLLFSTLTWGQTPAKMKLNEVIKLRTEQMRALNKKALSLKKDGIEVKKLKLTDLEMTYLEAGTGPVLVLLHGWPQHSHMWRKIIPTLSKKFRVIAPDLRGAGATTILPGGYDKKTMAGDVKAFLAALDIKKIYLAGYDMGGGVAYSFAAANPEMVEKLIIMEFALAGFGLESSLTFDKNINAGSNWHMGLFQIPEISELFLEDQKKEMLAWFFWHISCDPMAVTAENFKVYLDSISKKGAFRSGLLYYSALFQDLEDNKVLSQNKLKMPVLAVGGECSGGPYIEKLLSPVTSQVKGAVIPKAGHWLVDENAEGLTKVILDFL